MSSSRFPRVVLAAALATAAFAACADEPLPSGLSMISMVPAWHSAELSALAITGSEKLSVAAVETSAKGTTWVLQRAADGSRFSVTVPLGVSYAVGTAVTISALQTGWVLSQAGRAVAFIPNEIGAALLHNERITP